MNSKTLYFLFAELGGVRAIARLVERASEIEDLVDMAMLFTRIHRSVQESGDEPISHIFSRDFFGELGHGNRTDNDTPIDTMQ